MSEIVICERCREEIKEGYQRWQFSETDYSTNPDSSRLLGDFCSECAKKIRWAAEPLTLQENGNR